MYKKHYFKDQQFETDFTLKMGNCTSIPVDTNPPPAAFNRSDYVIEGLTDKEADVIVMIRSELSAKKEQGAAALLKAQQTREKFVELVIKIANLNSLPPTASSMPTPDPESMSPALARRQFEQQLKRRPRFFEQEGEMPYLIK